MAEIFHSLAYLTENLTNVSTILVHLIEHGIISENEREEILIGGTSWEMNLNLLNIIQKKDWENIKESFAKILRETYNGHCADKIEQSLKYQLTLKESDKITKNNETVRMNNFENQEEFEMTSMITISTASVNNDNQWLGEPKSVVLLHEETKEVSTKNHGNNKIAIQNGAKVGPPKKEHKISVKKAKRAMIIISLGVVAIILIKIMVMF